MRDQDEVSSDDKGNLDPREQHKVVTEKVEPVVEKTTTTEETTTIEK